ncbi:MULTISPECIES: hypothetical protein [Bacillaceae]|nr:MULTISPECIES: hypothetical protein [Bacillaceae]MED3793146.1 hypothetical protein [Niallia alba]
MAFIKGMNAEIAGGKEKSGVHQGDERPKSSIKKNVIHQAS